MGGGEEAYSISVNKKGFNSYKPVRERQKIQIRKWAKDSNRRFTDKEIQKG